MDWYARYVEKVAKPKVIKVIAGATREEIDDVIHSAFGEHQNGAGINAERIWFGTGKIDGRDARVEYHPRNGKFVQMYQDWQGYWED